eukprot:Clim_evm8s2 gene=Clim_evmTU8s2
MARRRSKTISAKGTMPTATPMNAVKAVEATSASLDVKESSSTPPLKSEEHTKGVAWVVGTAGCELVLAKVLNHIRARNHDFVQQQLGWEDWKEDVDLHLVNMDWQVFYPKQAIGVTIEELVTCMREPMGGRPSTPSKRNQGAPELMWIVYDSADEKSQRDLVCLLSSKELEACVTNFGIKIVIVDNFENDTQEPACPPDVALDRSTKFGPDMDVLVTPSHERPHEVPHSTAARTESALKYLSARKECSIRPERYLCTGEIQSRGLALAQLYFVQEGAKEKQLHNLQMAVVSKFQNHVMASLGDPIDGATGSLAVEKTLPDATVVQDTPVYVRHSRRVEGEDQTIASQSWMYSIFIEEKGIKNLSEVMGLFGAISHYVVLKVTYEDLIEDDRNRTVNPDGGILRALCHHGSVHTGAIWRQRERVEFRGILILDCPDAAMRLAKLRQSRAGSAYFVFHFRAYQNCCFTGSLAAGVPDRQSQRTQIENSNALNDTLADVKQNLSNVDNVLDNSIISEAAENVSVQAQDLPVTPDRRAPSRKRKATPSSKKQKKAIARTPVRSSPRIAKQKSLADANNETMQHMEQNATPIGNQSQSSRLPSRIHTPESRGLPRSSTVKNPEAGNSTNISGAQLADAVSGPEGEGQETGANFVITVDGSATIPFANASNVNSRSVNTSKPSKRDDESILVNNASVDESERMEMDSTLQNQKAIADIVAAAHRDDEEDESNKRPGDAIMAMLTGEASNNQVDAMLSQFGSKKRTTRRTKTNVPVSLAGQKNRNTRLNHRRDLLQQQDALSSTGLPVHPSSTATLNGPVQPKQSLLEQVKSGYNTNIMIPSQSVASNAPERKRLGMETFDDELGANDENNPAIANGVKRARVNAKDAMKGNVPGSATAKTQVDADVKRHNNELIDSLVQSVLGGKTSTSFRCSVALMLGPGLMSRRLTEIQVLPFVHHTYSALLMRKHLEQRITGASGRVPGENNNNDDA